MSRFTSSSIQFPNPCIEKTRGVRLGHNGFMRRHVGFTVLLVLSVGLLVQHVRLEQQDHGWLLNVYESRVDVQGHWIDAKSSLQRLTLPCQTLQTVPSDTELQVLRAIQLHSPPDSDSAELLQVSVQGAWALAEVGFDRLSPAVVLLEYDQGTWRIPATGIWSGTTHPWRANPLIRRYLMSRNPLAPATLLQCWQAQHPLWVSGSV